MVGNGKKDAGYCARRADVFTEKWGEFYKSWYQKHIDNKDKIFRVSKNFVTFKCVNAMLPKKRNHID